MAEALLISRTDVVKFTAMNGNVDTDKFIQFIKIAYTKHFKLNLVKSLVKNFNWLPTKNQTKIFFSKVKKIFFPKLN